MTLTDLYTATLQELGVLAAGEVAEADDTDKVAEKYRALYAMLEHKNLVQWGETDDVPTYAEVPLTYMLAFLCAPAFGVSGQKRQELGVLGAIDAGQPSLAERMLIKQGTKRFHYTPVRTESF